MKYMCIVLVDDDLAACMSPADWTVMNEQSKAYDCGLAERGVLLAAEALVGREAARTVRVRQGAAIVTDGPFMETKEVVAGFILEEASDLDEAMQIAQVIPMARLGAVEVRPVLQF